jgi:hypothetical protein
MNTQLIDQKARDMAANAMSAIVAHDKECAMYRKGTMQTLGDIKRILAWGIASLIGAMGTIILMLLTRAH